MNLPVWPGWPEPKFERGVVNPVEPLSAVVSGTKFLTLVKFLTRAKFPTSVLCVGVVLLCGCNGKPNAEASAAAGTTGTTQGKGGGKGGRADGPVSVLVAKAVTKNIPIQAEVIGNVESSSTVTLRPQISGQVLTAHFQEGDFVTKGQLLLTIDSRSLEAQLKQLEAQIMRDEAASSQATASLARDRAQETNARSQLDRAEQLWKQGILSKEQHDQYSTTLASLAATLQADQASIESAKASIAASKAAVENQRVQISYAKIFAPISGRTGTLIAKPGNVVSANNTDLLTINQVQPLYVTFALPESNLPVLRRNAGNKLPVTALSEVGGVKDSGTLAFFENAVDPTTGTIKLKATFPNKDRALWPGQFVRVTLQLGERTGATLVPNQAVQSGQEGTFVYIVKADQRVDVRPVVTAERFGEETVIQKGVQPGETVVTEGTLRLIPGSRIQVRDPQAPGGGGRRGGKGGAGKGGEGKGSEGKGSEDKGSETSKRS